MTESTLEWQVSSLALQLLSERAQKVIRHWVSSGPFRDVTGAPGLLYLAGDGEKSFVSLAVEAGCRACTTSVLEEMTHMGMVEQDSAARVLLRRAAYAPAAPSAGSVVGREQLGEAS
ncbi:MULTISPECIES: hypothetical protein [Halomonadaceae]|uniref:Uncharacterized protein n=1 Tax=Vreelandella halophila TaxID=86177 RepID=A0A9X5B598_9GAMM|nr:MULTISPECIES: hypothetical protein [Halomonas]MYL25947.1 hypothetical protein [Halomonas utahensis]MYL73491.1 hypothetical protein [Halomonas sp. 22501_18_FS]